MTQQVYEVHPRSAGPITVVELSRLIGACQDARQLLMLTGAIFLIVRMLHQT